jgi:Zn-dependent protease with chaperone function
MNAFAAKLLGSTFIILNADVLSLAVRRGPAAVSFVVGHELGHHWRGHLNWRWLTIPARLIPYMGNAYSRACEYTCDRVGAFCDPAGAIDGLLVLAAGGWLHTHVDGEVFARQASTDVGFWVRLAEWMSSHPRLPKRVAALLAMGMPAPTTDPLGVPAPLPAGEGYSRPSPGALTV